MNQETAVAVFGGGCFWCTEAVFQSLRGVKSVMSGYAGGKASNPSYEQVSSGSSGHAEVIKVEYSPTQISYQDLLIIFFDSHDPTQVNRQGNDVGTQYRSIILYSTDEQQQQAAEYIKKLNSGQYKDHPVVTKLEPLTDFYAAETYHQRFYKQNPTQNYCRLVISPKLEKLQAKSAKYQAFAKDSD